VHGSAGADPIAKFIEEKRASIHHTFDIDDIVSEIYGRLKAEDILLNDLQKGTDNKYLLLHPKAMAFN
jgi:hypothetical protein